MPSRLCLVWLGLVMLDSDKGQASTGQTRLGLPRPGPGVAWLALARASLLCLVWFGLANLGLAWLIQASPGLARRSLALPGVA